MPGLGFYAYLRFHVDSTKFRRWNMDPAVAAECPPIVHPEDIARSASRCRRRQRAVAAHAAATTAPGPPQPPHRPQPERGHPH